MYCHCKVCKFAFFKSKNNKEPPDYGFLFYLSTGVLPIVYYTFYIIVILASFQSIRGIFLQTLNAG
jgi:hypothetical protein